MTPSPGEDAGQADRCLRRVTSVPWPKELIMPRLGGPAVCARCWCFECRLGEHDVGERCLEDLDDLRAAGPQAGQSRLPGRSVAMVPRAWCRAQVPCELLPVLPWVHDRPCTAAARASPGPLCAAHRGGQGQGCAGLGRCPVSVVAGRGGQQRRLALEAGVAGRQCPDRCAASVISSPLPHQGTHGGRFCQLGRHNRGVPHLRFR
jgi:hypothetical protein